MSESNSTPPATNRAVIDWTAEPDEWMRAQIEAAPPLTNQQRTALAELLKPVRVNAPGRRGGAA